MKTKQIEDLIKEAENFSPIKYPCSKGIQTIGYGRTYLTTKEAERLHVDSFESLGHITMENAEKLLKSDILKCVGKLQVELQYFAMLPNEVQTVLVDMAFNMGISRLMSFKKTIGFISQGKYNEASAELLDSDYCSDVKGRALRNSIALASGKFVDLDTCKKMWKQLKGRV